MSDTETFPEGTKVYTDEKGRRVVDSTSTIRRQAMREAVTSGALQGLFDDWGFREVRESEHEAMVALLRGKHFGEPVSEIKPILMHKVEYNDTLETATVVQPHSLAIVTNLATGASAIMYGILNEVSPVMEPKVNERGLTVLNPLTDGPEVTVKRKRGRVVYNYDWVAVAVRAITAEDVEDDGLFDLATVIGEAFADLLIDPDDTRPEAPVTATSGTVDFSQVSF